MGSHPISRRPVLGGATGSSQRAAGDVGEALDAIRRIVRALRVSSRATEKQLAVSGAQLFVLQQLAGAPASSIVELAQRTITDASSVSVVVGRLVEKGLAKRAPSKLDARRFEIALTAKGRGLVARAPEPAQARLVEGLRRMSPSEIRTLAAGLARLVETMGAGDERAAMFFEDDAPTRSPRAVRAAPARTRATKSPARARGQR